MQEAKNAHAWQIARWSTWHLLNVQLAKKDKLKSPADLISLPGDKEAKLAVHKKATQIDERTRERWRKWDEDAKRLRQK